MSEENAASCTSDRAIVTRSRRIAVEPTGNHFVILQCGQLGEKPQRNAEIVRMMLAGDSTLKEIGDRFGLSRERVRQIGMRFFRSAIVTDMQRATRIWFRGSPGKKESWPLYIKAHRGWLLKALDMTLRSVSTKAGKPGKTDE